MQILREAVLFVVLLAILVGIVKYSDRDRGTGTTAGVPQVATAAPLPVPAPLPIPTPALLTPDCAPPSVRSFLATGLVIGSSMLTLLGLCGGAFFAVGWWRRRRQLAPEVISVGAYGGMSTPRSARAATPNARHTSIIDVSPWEILAPDLTLILLEHPAWATSDVAWVPFASREAIIQQLQRRLESPQVRCAASYQVAVFRGVRLPLRTLSAWWRHFWWCWKLWMGNSWRSSPSPFGRQRGPATPADERDAAVSAVDQRNVTVAGTAAQLTSEVLAQPPA